MLKILIVDDSETEIAILKHIFESEKDICIIGFAKNGKEAVRLVPLLKPDLITMDIQMPVMDGFEATRHIMAEYPTPIVVISSQLNENMNTTFHALNAGALSVIEKPMNITSPTFSQISKRIIDTVRSMSEIKVIKQHLSSLKYKKNFSSSPVTKKNSTYEIVAIGASIGGPQALNFILSHLPAKFPLPIVVVQHMTPGFIHGLSVWLNDHTGLTVKLAENLELLQQGTVYFAPDNYHLELIQTHDKLMTKLIPGPKVAGFCPSITELLKSIAKICGPRAIGILLTGMGSDGAQGLLALKKARGHTLIQDPESAIVFGMANVAQSLQAVDRIVDLDKIAEYLIKITHSAT